MKGGFNNPPNLRLHRPPELPVRASMKGGFNNPPNLTEIQAATIIHPASMKGGFNNPPNVLDRRQRLSARVRFNEGGVQ